MATDISSEHVTFVYLSKRREPLNTPQNVDTAELEDLPLSKPASLVMLWEGEK